MAMIDWGFVGLHVLISMGGLMMFIALAPFDDKPELPEPRQPANRR